MEVPLKDSPSNMSDEKEEEGVAPHYRKVYENDSALFNFPMETPQASPSNQSELDFS